MNDEADDIPDELLEHDEEEFSLSQLSQAYAKVLKVAVDGDVPSHPDSTSAAHPIDLSSHVDASFPSRKTAGQGPVPPDSPASTDSELADNAGCPITPESIVEAILFVGAPAGETLTPKKIATLLRDISPKEIKQIVKKLNERYERDQAVFRIRFEEGNLTLELEEVMLPFQQTYLKKNKGYKLNPAAIEVLAIIAYKQPISREEIENLRNKPSGSIINQLIRRGLLTPAERLKKGDPIRYTTSDKFLDFFNLTELADLPQSYEVSDLDELLGS